MEDSCLSRGCVYYSLHLKPQSKHKHLCHYASNITSLLQLSIPLIMQPRITLALSTTVPHWEPVKSCSAVFNLKEQIVRR